MGLEEQVAALAEEVKSLKQQLQAQEDATAIRRVHYAYGYYIDKCLYNEAIELFADDCEVHFHGGIYRGKEGASRIYQKWFAKIFVNGRNGPIHGLLLDHLIMQDIVTVAPDGKTGYLRGRCLMQCGHHKSVAEARKPKPGQDVAPGDAVPEPSWESGIHENVYIKGVDGKWRIKVLNYKPTWQATYEDGWGNAPLHAFPPFEKLYPDDPRGPDELVNDPNGQWFWPDTHVIPFHYNHPINGKQVNQEDATAPKPEGEK